MTTSKIPNPVTVTDELLLLLLKEVRALRVDLAATLKKQTQDVDRVLHDIGDAQKRAAAVMKQIEQQGKKTK